MENKKNRILRRFRKWSCILLSYLILNAGIFGWIAVSASSGNKLRQHQTAMAEVTGTQDTDLAVQISVLEHPVQIDASILHTIPAQTALLTMLDPFSIGLLAILTA